MNAHLPRFLAGLLLTLLALAAPPLQAQSAAPAAVAEYRLAAGDVLRISVYQNPDLTLETRVSETGVLNFPLLGGVRVGGLSVSAAEQLLAEGLKSGNYVKQPQVTVLVMQVRGNQASVLGHVTKPGRYPLETGGVRLTDLLAAASGTTAFAGDLVVVTGTRNGQPYRAEVDLPALFSANNRAKDFEILNGDVIWVDRAPVIYIYGEVQKAGVVRLDREMTLMQALAAGGGLTPRGTERGIRVSRRGSDGKVQQLQPPMDDKLKDGDVVQVRESLF